MTMTAAERRTRDLARLQTVHPVLRGVVSQILQALDVLGFPMTVTAAVRTVAEQFELFQHGRHQVGVEWVYDDPVRKTGTVTEADGTVKRSNHQAAPDGLGRAVDCAFLVDGPDADTEPDLPSWDDRNPWSLYGEMAEALGRALPVGQSVVWGGRWKQPHDLPHVELKLS